MSITTKSLFSGVAAPVASLSLSLVLALGACSSSDGGGTPGGTGGSTSGTGGSQRTGGTSGGSGGVTGSGGVAGGNGGTAGGTGGSTPGGTGGGAGSPGEGGAGGSPAGTGGGMAAGTGGSSGDAGGGGPEVPPPLTGKAFVYAAGFEGGDTITTFSFDLGTGMLMRLGGTPGGASPDYVAIHPGGKFLFVNNEVGSGRATAFAVGADGALSKLNDTSSGGGGPAHIWAHSSGKWVMSANYNDGKVAAMPVAADGKLGAPASVQTAGGNAHMVLDDGQSGNFVFVPCASAGHVAMYKFDVNSGQLTPNSPATISNPQRPRHMAFNPNGKWAYLTHESRQAITTFAYDSATGLLSAPKDTTAPNDGAHVVVHPSGNFVFHIARGGGTTTVFKVGPDGALSSAGTAPGGGYDATITKDGKYLITVSGTSVRVFSINATTGALTAAGNGTTLQRSQSVAVTVL